MTQPLDRQCRLPALGEIDESAGEFWVENPFLIPLMGKNLSAYERNRIYLNLGGTDFLDASFASRADVDSDSRSVIAADFNGDGAPDLLVGSVGGGPLRLFLNRIPQGRRLRLALVGKESNRAAIGARVTLECGGRNIVRDLFPENGFMGQGPGELLIGLGSADVVDRATIRWPSGKRQTLEGLRAGTIVTIVEGEPQFETANLRPN